MELRHLRYFVAVAEERHFGRAAQRLHIVQPALSKQVIALERELGVELFDRSHGVTLTPAGEVFYEEARLIVQRADRAVRTTQATARGELGSLDIGFIGSSMWSVVPPILREHRRRHPQLRFRLHQLSSPEQAERIRDGSLDVGFVRPPAHDDALVFEPVWSERFVVVLADDHPVAATATIDLADLKDETFVVLPRRNAAALHDLSLSICLGYGFSPKTIEEGNSPAALHMVAMGLGVALVPESALDAGLAGMAVRPLTHATPEVELALCYRRASTSATVRAFRETIRNTLPHVRARGRVAAAPPPGPLESTAHA